MNKAALIIGITGQDGSYLAELLLQKGYQVHGLRRRISSFNTERIDHLLSNPNLKLHYGDVTDFSALLSIIKRTDPDEIYNLAAMSHVHISFEMPNYTGQVDGIGTLNVLEAVRLTNDKIKVYQASTSELFGKVQEVPQNEETPFYPRSPYGVAKLYGFWIVKNYREAYNLYCVNGILFNHESPRRGEIFVTRKITMAAAAIKLGKQKELILGNLNSERDWGHAKDYVTGMWKMLQQEKPEDYVLATNKTTSIRDFVHKTFSHIGIKLKFEGNGINEVGIVLSSNSEFVKPGQEIVKVSEKYFRPTEVDLLIGDYSKAKINLNWEPKIDLDEMIIEMVENDLKLISNGLYGN